MKLFDVAEPERSTRDLSSPILFRRCRKRTPQYLFPMFVLLIMAPQLFSASLELKFKKGNRLSIVWRFDKPLTEGESSEVLHIRDVINQRYPDEMRASTFFEGQGKQYPAIKLDVQNIQDFQDTLNFLDFKYKKSFFKEKYYMKIILNPALLESKFFKVLDDEGVEFSRFDQLLSGYQFLYLHVFFPGRCVATNMNHDGSGYTYRISLQEFNSRGGMVYFQSSHFISLVSITILGVLLLCFLFVALTIPSFLRKRRHIMVAG